ncbi:hypothetical protein HAX54_023467 [Datura stramonium]|uniref:Uncharacterized protein n=1 Tax=Datura stramonium TaxID=4076 RepID=A0ABS8S4Q9_DATST|nr:hypothetical protein [Datura stramonium]
MAAPGGPRPMNAPPPNYNPNALADGMQNLQVNRSNQPPSAPRPNTPFGQQPPFAGGPPVSCPGPPPPGVFLRGHAPPSGPPHTGFPPPVSQSVPPFASRPPPPGVMPPSMGGAAPPPGSFPSALGPRPGPPGPFSSSPLTTGPVVPRPSGISSSVNNGPPAGGPGMMQAGARFPPPSNTMGPPFGASPPAMVSPGASSQPSGMRSPFGSSSSISTTPVTAQPPLPFSGSFQNVPPPSGSSLFAAPGQAMPPPMGAPYGTQSRQLPPHQGAPPSVIPGSMQPPSMYGMAPPLPNQAGASINPSIGHTSPSKVDPNQIPRPIPNASVVLHETRQGNQANPPPPAISDYIVKDTGNCSPRYMRCTINQIPCTVDLLTTSAMQLALLVQPLALPHPSEEALQTKNERGKPLWNRQSKSFAWGKITVTLMKDDIRYIFIQRARGGDFGERVLFGAPLQRLYNPFVKFIDQGRRFICNLCRHTDETPRDYQCNLGPDGRRRDADERPELCRGTVEFVATQGIWLKVRDPMPAVYFFLIDVSMNAIQTGATAAACSHGSWCSDLLCLHPLQTDVIVQLSECRQHLELLLESIPTMFQNNRTADSAFGAAVKYYVSACRCRDGSSTRLILTWRFVTSGLFLGNESTGEGNFLCFNQLPSAGIGALSAREAEGRTNVSCRKSLLRTGESLYVDGTSLEAHKLLQPADKTRTMAGVGEYQVCVDVFLTTQSYVDIASISVLPRTTGGQAGFKDVSLVSGVLLFPAALADTAKLYNDLRWNITRPQGFEAVMRGLQVQEYSGNYCKRIPTDVDLPAIDCDKTIMVTLKHDDKLQDGSECSFQLTWTPNFACILKQAAVSSSGQLVLPEALKLLPLYTLALVKSTALRTDGQIDSRLIAIHELDTKENDSPLVPPSIPLSSEHISDNDPDVIRQLLGISSVEEIPAQFVLQQYDNPLSKKLNDIINDIRCQRCNYLRLKLCKKGDSSGMLFLSHMVEDKTQSGLSYVEFLVHIHRHIQNKMA